MARKYYTLCTRDDGVWAPQFGDYSKETVEGERDDYRDGSQGYKAKDLRIITTGPAQADINVAVAKLNAKAAPVAAEAPKAPELPAIAHEQAAAWWRSAGDVHGTPAECDAIAAEHEAAAIAQAPVPSAGVTPSEHKVLRSLYTNAYGDRGDSIWSWAVDDSMEPTGLAKSSIPGVIASLIKKGLAHSEQYSPTERTCGLTKAGQELAERIGAFPKVAS